MKQPVAQQVHVDAPWKIPPRAWWEILKRVYGALSANHVGLLAAGVAYYAFLSIAPMMAAVVLTYGLFGDPAMVGRHMQAIIAVVPADAAKLINDQLLGMVSARKPAIGFGLFLALGLAVYGATRAASAIMEALKEQIATQKRGSTATSKRCGRSWRRRRRPRTTGGARSWRSGWTRCPSPSERSSGRGRPRRCRRRTCSG